MSAGEIVLPADVALERAVIGGLLLDPGQLPFVAELRPEDFTAATYRDAFVAIREMDAAGDAIDAPLVARRVAGGERGRYVQVAPDLAAAIDGVPRAPVAGYVPLLRELGERRRLLRGFAQLAEDAQAGRASAELAREADALLHGIGGAGPDTFEPADVGLERLLSDLEERYQNRDRLAGHTTGFSRLDTATTGLRPGQLWVLAGRTSHGKSALALNIARAAAVHGGAAVGIFSLEMSRDEVWSRLLACEANVSAQDLRTGSLARDEWDRIVSARACLGALALHVDDTGGLTVGSLRARARRLARAGRLDMLIVDYLQLARADQRTENRTVEVTAISRALKALAKELHVPVLALAQLRRPPEGREDAEPTLYDLRESGAIEQDADVVLLVHRPELVARSPETRQKWDGRALLYLAKQRNGPLGTYTLTFDRALQRFAEEL